MTAEVPETSQVVGNNSEEDELKATAENDPIQMDAAGREVEDEGDGNDGNDDVDDVDDDLSLGGSEGSEDGMDFDEADNDADDDDDDVEEQQPVKKKAKTLPNSASEESAASITSGWADAMSKILASDKQILSKAKKDKDVVMKKTTTNKKKNDDGELEVVGGEGIDEEGEDEEGGGKEKKEKRKADAALKAIHYGRTKPHLFERQFERSLTRIATRGVIQLFNAVSKHQKETKDKIKKEGKSEFKKDAILKSVSKGDFIDLLKETNTTTAKPAGKGGEKKTTPPVQRQREQLPVTESTWKILRDDFMMTKGKSMKDWDKESDSDD